MIITKTTIDLNLNFQNSSWYPKLKCMWFWVWRLDQFDVVTSSLVLIRSRNTKWRRPVESISQKECNILVKQESRWDGKVLFCIEMLKICLLTSFHFALQLPFNETLLRMLSLDLLDKVAKRLDFHSTAIIFLDFFDKDQTSLNITRITQQGGQTARFFVE